MRFAEPELPDVVYIEQLTRGLYLDGREDVDQYLEVMNELSAPALTPDRTARFLAGSSGRCSALPWRLPAAGGRP
jgi:hypothetical protein